VLDIGSLQENNHKNKMHRLSYPVVLFTVLLLLAVVAHTARTFYPKTVPLTTEQLIKMRCSLDSREQVITAWTGFAYSVIPQSASKTLFGLAGVNIARCLYVNGTWQLTSRELMLYLDPVTGQKLKQWNNPFTGEVNTVMHVANSPVQQVFTYAVNATQVNKQHTVLPLDINLLYPNSLSRNATYAPYSPQPMYQAGEFFKFIAPTKDVNNKKKKTVSELEFSWTRYSPFLPFMKMGNQQGYLLFSAQGAKVSSINELPDVLLNEIKQRVPIYKNAPPCILNTSSETSWTYFAKYFTQYLAGEEFPIPISTDNTPCK
jgi:hypothetical protein